MNFLETDRLILRKYTLEDLPIVTAQRTTPEIAKFIGGTKIQTPEFVVKRINFTLDCYEKYGFGVMAMIWKETGELIGWSGLQPLEDSGEIEVAYGMIESFWGKGIGFECAKAWLEYGFNVAKLEKIVACAEEGNIGSWRIMEKCGMKFEDIRHHYGLELKFYTITKDEFLKT
jgi:[ribosomal protein S5]-alanine N-acetyltransferase